jgi:predicted dienelactone hydrolase
MMKSRQSFFLVTMGLLLMTGCSNASLYKFEPGPFEILAANEIRIPDPIQQRDVTFRVLHPDGAGPFPVVVFSTGGFCPSQMYERIASHWVSHGYVFIAPNHVDSPNNPRAPGPAEMAVIVPSRIRDASLALDALDEIGQQANISGDLESDRVGIGGHSFGSGIAMMKIGMYTTEGERGAWGDAYDDRFRAAILLSPPGDSEETSADAFAGLRKPFIATGGTQDVGRIDPGGMAPGEWRRRAWLLAPPGDKYSAILDGADHYLGGLICNPERGGDPDPEAVAIVRALTLAFLDAYIKDERAAREFLLTANVSARTQGRVDYRYR